MTLARSLRAVCRLLVAALPLLAVAMGIQEMTPATKYARLVSSRGYVDLPEQMETRLSPLRGLLPRYGRVGYLDPDEPYRTPQATRAFYLTQYVLAPRVVVSGSEAEYVIYSSHLGKALTADLIPEGMHVMKQIAPDLAVLVRPAR